MAVQDQIVIIILQLHDQTLQPRGSFLQRVSQLNAAAAALSSHLSLHRALCTTRQPKPADQM